MISAEEAKQAMLETIEAAQAEAVVEQVAKIQEFKNHLLNSIEARIKGHSEAGKSKSLWDRAIFKQQLKQIPFTPEAESGTDKVIDHFEEVKELLINSGYEVIVEKNINPHAPDNVYIEWA